MKITHTIPAAALSNDYNEQGCSTSVRTGALFLVGGRAYGFGYVDASGSSRREHGGPVLPGPYAYTWAKAVVIDNFGGSGAERAEVARRGLVLDAQVGDTVIMPDGVEFVVGAEHGEIVLVPVEVEEAS